MCRTLGASAGAARDVPEPLIRSCFIGWKRIPAAPAKPGARLPEDVAEPQPLPSSEPYLRAADTSAQPLEAHGHCVNGATKILLAARTKPAPKQLRSPPRSPQYCHFSSSRVDLSIGGSRARFCKNHATFIPVNDIIKRLEAEQREAIACLFCFLLCLLDQSCKHQCWLNAEIELVQTGLVLQGEAGKWGQRAAVRPWKNITEGCKKTFPPPPFCLRMEYIFFFYFC